MLHKRRVWSVAKVESPEDLAEKLTQHTWCCCNAFELQGYVFANDATSADGAQEYAVVMPVSHEIDFMQIESITFSWCSREKALELIGKVVAGEFDSDRYDRVHRRHFQTPAEHGRCGHCA
jgi:hypothetical protein